MLDLICYLFGQLLTCCCRVFAAMSLEKLIDSYRRFPQLHGGHSLLLFWKEIVCVFLWFFFPSFVHKFSSFAASLWPSFPCFLGWESLLLRRDSKRDLCHFYLSTNKMQQSKGAGAGICGTEIRLSCLKSRAETDVTSQHPASTGLWKGGRAWPTSSLSTTGWLVWQMREGLLM